MSRLISDLLWHCKLKHLQLNVFTERLLISVETSELSPFQKLVDFSPPPRLTSPRPVHFLKFVECCPGNPEILSTRVVQYFRE